MAEIMIKCVVCGSELPIDRGELNLKYRGEIAWFVDPCEKCIKVAKDKAIADYERRSYERKDNG
jgi:C4-type Zn-finger protein